MFCNLISLKTGDYETLLVAIGEEFRKLGDEYVAVFTGEPIPSVVESLRVIGVRWKVMNAWVAPKRKLSVDGCSLLGNDNKGAKKN
jgi:hypothetical protein